MVRMGIVVVLVGLSLVAALLVRDYRRFEREINELTRWRATP